MFCWLPNRGLGASLFMVPLVVKKKNHFIGISGTGMSAVAQFLAFSGGKVSGSDRYFDQGRNLEVKTSLEKLGITISPQDGSGITEDTAEVVVSTAIEDTNPEMARAKELSLPVIHRSELLARFVAEHTTIVVAGTSGKSTVTAMVYEVLDAAGLSPSVITGGNLIKLEEQGHIGNAFKGTGRLLVIEGDESDGSLTRYRAQTGLLLNMDKDHKELSELKGIFAAFIKNTGQVIINNHRPELTALCPECPGFNHAQDIKLQPDGSEFHVDGTAFSLPVPGQYNVENALAAIAACREHGVELPVIAEALKNYKGVARRFQKVGRKNGIMVIDDFAHNPAKIAASLTTAFLQGGRVLAVFQPHGFGSTRFLKNYLIAMFSQNLRKNDILYMPDIFYAGGTADKSISSKDIIDGVTAGGKKAVYCGNREGLLPVLKKESRSGDVILVMGARDPGLPGFCRAVADLL